MSRTFKLVGTAFVLSILSLSASEMVTEKTSQPETSLPPTTSEQATYPAKPMAPKKLAEPFRSFTGRVKAKKVRMRSNPDMESPIIKELQKGELVFVISEKGDFWGIEPPADCKAYVFRSFVLDGVVEGNHVNVRLEPSLDAPIIAHLSSGQKIEGQISSAHNKWLEITPPKGTCFYIAKDYLEVAGGPELKQQHDKRLGSVQQMLEAATALTKSEMKKPFERIEFDKLTRTYKAIVDEYSDFPHMVEKAQAHLASLQEEYMQKRLKYLEEKATTQGGAEVSQILDTPSPDSITERMKMWEHVEESLYLAWSGTNDDKSQEQYYEEQKLSATPITGILEIYQTTAKNKPGDYLLKDHNLPKACVYSTKVDLQKLVGKKVTLYAVERPNNNFAFPAYFVVDAE